MIRRTRAALAAGVLVLALGVAGCTDTTVEPKSTITEANVFSDPASYKQFLAKVYAGLAVSGQQGPAGNADIQGIDEGFSQYVRLFWSAQELPTDAAVIAWNDVGLPELNTQLWAAENSFVQAMYYRIFFQVALANEFLRQTTDAKLTERNVAASLRAEIEQYRAEVRLLRALSYWHAIDLFGNVPLVTEDFVRGAEPPEQATRAALYDFVVSEITAVRGDLPAPGGTNYGRATTAVADMLLAKLYLNSRVYTGVERAAEARAAAEAVIAAPFTLDPNLRRPFLADNNTSPEIIFPVIQDGVRTKTWGGMTFLVHAACGNQMTAADYGIDGCWWGLRLKPQTYNLFGAGDQRASFFFTTGQTVSVDAIGTFGNGIAAPKFQNRTSTGANGSNPTHVDPDFPMFRLADAYLMYAEAVLRGGGGSRAQALAYVNALRQRAYGGATGNITDAQLTLDFILAERGRELMWEGHRRTDLIRFGRFTGGAYLWQWKGGQLNGVATDAFRDLYPIPATELSANPKLEQNDGY